MAMNISNFYFEMLVYSSLRDRQWHVVIDCEAVCQLTMTVSNSHDSSASPPNLLPSESGTGFFLFFSFSELVSRTNCASRGED